MMFIQYYNFTLYAMMLNELNDKMTSALPPTDSRLRPDVRQMEIGDIGKSIKLLHSSLSFKLIAVNFMKFLLLGFSYLLTA